MLNLPAGVHIEDRLGTVVVVGRPLAQRHRGVPPGGARVRGGQWALNRGLGRASEAEVVEVSGRVRLVAGPSPVVVSCWTPAGVETRALEGGGEWVVHGNPVLYWWVGPVDLSAVPAEPPGLVDFLVGPDLDRMTRGLVRALMEQVWRISPHSNRAGTRLLGGPLPSEVRGPVQTTPMTLGAIELPPDGLPIVLGPDHPVTGGYPVPMVVPAYACDLMGQIPVGEVVRFNLVDTEHARKRHGSWIAERFRR